MFSTKEAIVAKPHEPETDAAIFHIDVRAHGKGYENYYKNAAEKYGVRYVPSLVNAARQVPGSKNLRLTYVDPIKGPTEEEFDLVVLAAGLKPAPGMAKLAEKLDVQLNEFGFVKTWDAAPVSTSRAGIQVCGVAAGPKDIPDTVGEASAAAGAIGEILADARFTSTIAKTYPPERDVANEEPRVGVFICRCGINIASVIAVEPLVTYAKSLPGVVHAEENLYTCSQDTQTKIQAQFVQITWKGPY
jgi:heterodisulfide reductase subunit A